MAASAAACALAVWLLVDDEDEDDDENAPQLCELCDERPEDQETDMTFGLCYQCGRMHCSTCRKKMIMVPRRRLPLCSTECLTCAHPQANMQKVQLNERGMVGAKCPWCRSPMESATPRYLLLRELLDRRPKGRHVKHCLFVRFRVPARCLRLDDAAAMAWRLTYARLAERRPARRSAR